jgi:hypothetical protein
MQRSTTICGHRGVWSLMDQAQAEYCREDSAMAYGAIPGDRRGCGWSGRAGSWPARPAPLAASRRRPASRWPGRPPSCTPPRPSDRWRSWCGVLGPGGDTSGPATHRPVVGPRDRADQPSPTSAIATRSPVSSSHSGDGRRRRWDAGWAAKSPRPDHLAGRQARQSTVAWPQAGGHGRLAAREAYFPLARVASGTGPNHPQPVPSFCNENHRG